MSRRALPLSRRTLLRGLGCAVALPLLDAMTPRLLASEPEPTRRLAFLYVPNGIDMPHWTPKAEGPLVGLPTVLEPLAPLRDDILVLSGLTLDKARANGDGPGDHARASAAFLTGCQPRKTAGADIEVGISVDQVAALDRGNDTSLPSLELGVEPARQAGNCDSGYSCAYSSSISWRTPHTPMGKEIHPRLAFERLFAFGSPHATATEAKRRRVLRRSILDYVREDAKRLERRLGGKDRRKLDEYLAAVRQLERRIERAEHMTGTGQGARSPEATPKAYGEHVRLLLDVVVLAFRADLTRIVTFMLADEGSTLSYPGLGVRGAHHQISHHGGDVKKIEQIRAINTYHVTHLAYLLRALKEAQDAEGSLLDASAIVYGSGICDGNRHNHDDLPVLVAGRAGGRLSPGRHVRVPKETPLTNLYLSLLERFDVDVPRLGDSTGRLGGLEA